MRVRRAHLDEVVAQHVGEKIAHLDVHGEKPVRADIVAIAAAIERPREAAHPVQFLDNDGFRAVPCGLVGRRQARRPATDNDESGHKQIIGRRSVEWGIIPSARCLKFARGWNHGANARVESLIMNESRTRIEHDSFGPIEVPADRLWGAQTQRSLVHFAISTEKMPDALLRALLIVKRCRRARQHAAWRCCRRQPPMPSSPRPTRAWPAGWRGNFRWSVWQTGSGTQTNMNVNEVLANRASELLGGARGEGRLVHANDDVNRGQSSNDVFPTAMHVAAAEAITNDLVPRSRGSPRTLDAKAAAFADIVKIGRTHLHGRHAADAGPGVLGLRGAARARAVEHRRRAAPRVRAGARRHGGRHRAQYAARVRRPRRGGDRGATPVCRSSARPTSSRRLPRTMRSCSCTARSKRWRRR